MPIDRYVLVEDVMRDYPATIRVFLDFRLGCVGCAIASFHTLEDTCREHGIAEAPFLTALREAAARGSDQELVSSGACSASTTS
ncbi:DUF1858 domain-containing protein [Rhodopseudomonas sp. B29]|uniref:DUF1858 domain-containing protein n=1 Tax=Rhodopseudomonas sp. B29 TaxID=95607 RepID=UPI0003461DEA|nr:DUF1858 domain-containing protein [Rhodopseudomonas sp. B29]